MPSAVLVSSHFARSKRRAGFHWIADAFRAAGWHVTFVTVGFSQLSRLKADHRFQYGFPAGANRLETLEPGLDSYVWFTPYHPLNRLPGIGKLLLGPIFRDYGDLPMPGLEASIAAADLVIFESTSGLMLVDRFRRLNPRARVVYRVSDDLQLLRAHPVVLAAEENALPLFDLISTPSSYIQRRFADLPTARLQLHGIDTTPFDMASPNPYDCGWEAHATFVGTSHLDAGSLQVAAEDFPTWQFHVVGPISGIPSRPNLRMHGELPFNETVPYIVHADIGLATWANAPGAESLSDSLKVIQYTYARLPIVAPDFLASTRSNVFAYHPGDRGSIHAALHAARQFDRSTVNRSAIGSWHDLAKGLAGPTLWP